MAIKCMMMTVSILIGVVTMGCGIHDTRDDDNTRDGFPDYNAIREIAYRFGDAALAHEYHRSYTITLSRELIGIIVDCYGDILADEEYEIDSGKFDDIKNSLRGSSIRNCELGTNDGCTGGTSERITYSDQSGEIFSGVVYHCGGRNTGDLCGDVGSFAVDVKALIPNLEDLLQ